jgi:hypothetical protein
MLNTSEVGTRLPTRQRKVIVTSIRSRTSWHSFPHAATLAMACLISSALWAATKSELSGTNPTRSAGVAGSVTTQSVVCNGGERRSTRSARLGR